MAGINKLVVLGVGLIGGSFALDLKRAGLVKHITGVGRSAANLQYALDQQIIDSASHDVASAVHDADLVLLAMPVGQMGAVMRAMAPHLSATAVVTDAGSTKADVVALFQQHLPAHLPRCVPGHPIAGSDLSGAAAARLGLYGGRKVVLTPLVETSAAAQAMVTNLWQACAAEVVSLDAALHDSIFATVSHWPHLLAFAYMNSVLARPDAALRLSLAGSGFRDFTRIAGSHPEMWRDIALANRTALLEELARTQTELARIAVALEAGDVASLDVLFQQASLARMAWQRGE